MKSITASERNIGKEILEGMREIKRGEYGRVTTIPSVASIREKWAYRSRALHNFSGYRRVRYTSGNKVGVHLASHGREKSASIARSCLVVLVPDSRRLTRKAYLWVSNQTIRESDPAPDRLPALSAAPFLNFILDRIALRHVEVWIGGGDGRERPGLIIGGDELRCD